MDGPAEEAISGHHSATFPRSRSCLGAQHVQRCARTYPWWPAPWESPHFDGEGRDRRTNQGQNLHAGMVSAAKLKSGIQEREVGSQQTPLLVVRQVEE